MGSGFSRHLHWLRHVTIPRQMRLGARLEMTIVPFTCQNVCVSHTMGT